MTENKKQGLILKNSNIYDKSTPMSGDYGTNEHIQSLNYKMAIQPTGRRYHNHEKWFWDYFHKDEANELDKPIAVT